MQFFFFYYIQQCSCYFLLLIKILKKEKMLDNIGINSLPFTRPQSAGLPRRQFGAIANHTNTENSDSVFLNNDRIILPVKEYSNKFLRENKPRDELIYNHSILKPKRSLIYVRKQMKSKRNKLGRQLKNKQNQVRSIKTEASHLSNINTNQSYANSCSTANQMDLHSRMPQTPLERCTSTMNKMERISTSRALEMFSRVFKNENIQRMRIRRQVINKTSDVHVKQVTLQDKVEKKPKTIISAQKKPNILTTPSTIFQKPKKNKMLFMDEENFQLAGW